MDRASIEILANAMNKIESRDANYRNNKRWMLLNDKLQKCYLMLAKDTYGENLRRYQETGEKKYAEKMKTAYDYLHKNRQGEIRL